MQLQGSTRTAQNTAVWKLLPASCDPSLGSEQRRSAAQVYGVAGIADRTHGKGKRSWYRPNIENGTLKPVC